MATVDEPTVVLGTEKATCEHCGSPLTADQRYCVVCGTRRGPSTLPDAMRGSNAPPPRRGAPPPSRGGSSPAITILAFIGALLLAMGVGILIGRTTNSSSKPPKVQVVTVGGTGVTPAAGQTAATAAQSATSSVATSSAATSSAPAAAAGGGVTHASGTVTKATVSATHSTASSSSKTKPGYNSKGQFTGNFFGGGG